MTDAGLDEHHEWIGRWWRPDRPEKVAAGVLTFDPSNGIRLRLIGGWQTRISTEIGEGLVAEHHEIERWPVVHGLSGNRRLTLIEPFAESSSGNYGEDPHDQTLRAFTLIDGYHLETPDSPAFIGASVTVENLTGWAQRGAAEWNAQNSGPHTRTAENEATTVTAQLGDIDATLSTSQGFWSMENRADGVLNTRSTQTSVTFSSAKPRSMESWLSLIGGITDLVSISTMSACAALTMHLELPPLVDNGMAGGRSEPRAVDVYEEHVVKPDSTRKVVFFNDFVLTEADLPWKTLLPSWMDVRERFAAARGLILGLRYITEGYLGSRVVSAVAAAEAFHRALELPPPILEEDFVALRNLLLSAAPKEQRSWVNDRVQWNEPSLKQRLVDLAERPGAFMKDLVPSPQTWARVAGRSRNDLAHRGDAGDDFEQLHAVVEVTAAVVVMNLLREVGVPEERLAAALETHTQFKGAAELARRHFSG